MQNQYEIELVGDLRTEVVHSATDTKIVTDAPLDNKGKGRTFSPTDLLAVSVGSCMVTTMGIAADQFGIDRMRMICESCILSSVNIDNAASVLLAADATRARDLRMKCMTFILQNFDAVSKTTSFTEMGRSNVELVLEILRKR